MIVVKNVLEARKVIKKETYHPLYILCISIVFFLFVSPGHTSQVHSSLLDDTVLSNLKWRCIGPANPGGRIDDFAVVENQPNIIYVGTASGGLWKTTNNGITWKPLFDKQETSSIGDVAISKSNSDIVWVGTGEANNRQSSSWGNGVYKSQDGGSTWINMGLQETHHIGRIVIHPTNPDTVYVAALGHLWGPNKERGIFKTMDGGKSWTKTLFIDENTGCVDVAIDPMNSHVLYAAAYQRRRTGWGFNGGGPGSGIYKTTDSGESWFRLTTGLPQGIMGRIGIDVYRKDPDIVYAIIENKEGGVFRSENKGLSWEKMSDINPRPIYYSQIRVDPGNDQRIWVLGAEMFFSEDGGKTWDTELIARRTREKRAVHGDHHAMWIDPSDSSHMMLGSDGGIYFSYDRGLTWDFIDTLPIAQVYEISYDMRKPYYVIGGLQDNGSWHGPSAAWFRPKITNDEWFRVGGADGFYSQIDPNDHTRIFVESQNAGIERLNLQTGEYKPLRPVPKDPEDTYRFNWNSPFLMSSHDSDTLYLGGNKLFISTDGGENWKATIDLTKQQNREHLPIMGSLPDDETLSKHDGILYYGTITTISESPLQKGLLYVGTDDGNIQITRDCGETWHNVLNNIPGIPKNTYVSRIIASQHSLGRAYVTFDGHRNDDFKAYIFMTRDFGENWIDISNNLPEGGTVNVIREHHRNPNLLFIGTERGAYFSLDRGNQWVKFRNEFPIVPVDDIAIHPRDNDLIFGTHGRSIWILDDITPLEKLTQNVLELPCHLFDIRPATVYNFFSRRAHYDYKGLFGHKIFRAPNPPYGAIISYYLQRKIDERVKIIITDMTGTKIREMEGTRMPGINRVIWDLRHGYSCPTPPAKPEMKTGPSVVPGEYKITLKYSDHELTKTVLVEEDPDVNLSLKERKKQHDVLLRIYKLNPVIAEVNQATISINNDLRSINSQLEKNPKIPDTVHQKIKVVDDEISGISKKLNGDPNNGSEARYFSIRSIQSIARSIESYSEAPTEFQVQQTEEKYEELKVVVKQINKIIEVDIPELNRILNKYNVPHLPVRKPIKFNMN
jgi:photosystem II stability/assembly factor-like uncharacterized protein